MGNNGQTEDFLPGCKDWNTDMAQLNTFLESLGLSRRMLEIKKKFSKPSITFPICVGCKAEIKRQILWTNHRYCPECARCNNEKAIYREKKQAAEKWLAGCLGISLQSSYHLLCGNCKKWTLSREAIRKTLGIKCVKARRHMKESEIMPDMVFALCYCWCAENAKRCKKKLDKNGLKKRKYKRMFSYWARIQWLYANDRIEDALLYEAAIPPKNQKIFQDFTKQFPFSQFSEGNNKDALSGMVKKNPFQNI